MKVIENSFECVFLIWENSAEYSFIVISVTNGICYINFRIEKIPYFVNRRVYSLITMYLIYTLHNFYENIFYKNLEAQIAEKSRIN